ncbi:MAG: AtpZ/AtpI family protein [Bacillota bacterium]
MPEKKNGLSRPLKAFALASTISVQFAASIVLGWWLGRFLDCKLGTDPWLMLGGLLTGIVAGMVGVYHTVAHVFNNRPRGKDRS